jgi:hypothetical protein
LKAGELKVGELGRAVVVEYPASDYSSTGQEIEDEDNNGENQQDVNPAAEGVAADEAYDP